MHAPGPHLETSVDFNVLLN